MAYERGTGVSENKFGIMELLAKLFKERGTGISDKEQGIMGKATEKGSGYESFIDKNTGEFKRTDTTYQAGEMQTIDPLANTLPYNNATTNALDAMRGFVPYTNQGSVSDREMAQFSGGGIYTDPNTGVVNRNLGAVSDQEMQHFQGAASNVDTMFAQALNALPPREQAEIIQTTQGYTEEQVENFKIQYLQGRVSSYELERPYLQSNLGFQ